MLSFQDTMKSFLQTKVRKSSLPISAARAEDLVFGGSDGASPAQTIDDS